MVMHSFLVEIMPTVQEVCNRWEMFSSIAGAQAYLESAKGTSELAVNAKNIFGKKWNKGVFDPYYKVTNEYLKLTLEEAIAEGWTPVNPERGLYSKPLPFNIYPTWEDCINHYCENIMMKAWYADARTYLYDRALFLEHLAPIYAPNHPTYVEDVMRIIEEQELTPWDTGIQ